MQSAPLRLSQTIWSAFRASKPVTRPQRRLQPRLHQSPQQWLLRGPTRSQFRTYSDRKGDVDRKVEEVKARLDDSLDARAGAASQPDTVKPAHEDTIMHTNPESSSIVHPTNHESTSQPNSYRPSNDSLTSQKPSNTSPLRHRFSAFMDNFQTHIFTASRRLNDLTGYSGIEALKNTITSQEALVSTSRRAVKDARAKYADTIATRSTTQREVNDLLHRKHNWTPTDLERFTSLYRSDHANEQAEAKAQTEVSEAEAAYEEASTTLARTILARYHEEQIWSDKIRQMSTWGTWGLMGLNVLLFVVFQIAIEPWRRKRLVKGFEEKVEVALRERDEWVSKSLVYGNADGGLRPNADAATAGEKVEGLADHIAEQIVDAISGTSTSDNTPTHGSTAETTTPTDASSSDAEFPATTSAYASPSGFASYQETFQDLFSERKLVVTRKEVTNIALEGAVGGAAVMGLLLVLLRPR